MTQTVVYVDFLTSCVTPDHLAVHHLVLVGGIGAWWDNDVEDCAVGLFVDDQLVDHHRPSLVDFSYSSSLLL
jgi:hypothetical protein